MSLDLSPSRAWRACTLLLALAACNAKSTAPAAEIAFQLLPASIGYHYTDTRTPTLDLTWLPRNRYYGQACLIFDAADSTRIKPSGAFRFVHSGSNAGSVERRQGSFVDTVSANVFLGVEGSGGSYVAQADSHLTLTWRDGQHYRVFDPSAVHILHGDSIVSTYHGSLYGDSLQFDWRVTWFRFSC